MARNQTAAQKKDAEDKALEESKAAEVLAAKVSEEAKDEAQAELDAKAAELAAEQAAEAEADAGNDNDDIDEAPKSEVVRLIAIKNKLTNGVTMDMYNTITPTVASQGLGNWENAQIKAGLLRVVED